MPPKEEPNVATKPGEPEFKLKLEPEGKMLFKGKIGDSITVEKMITNTTPDRQAYKIKCTANDVFRVRQPLGFIEPKETAKVRITFTGKAEPEKGKHFFAFFHIKSDKAKDGDKAARAIWTNTAKPEGITRQWCTFELEGGAKDEKKEEKKKEEKKEDKEEKKEEKKEDEKKEDKKEEKKEEEKKEAKKEEEKKEEEKK